MKTSSNVMGTVKYNPIKHKRFIGKLIANNILTIFLRFKNISDEETSVIEDDHISKYKKIRIIKTFGSK